MEKYVWTEAMFKDVWSWEEGESESVRVFGIYAMVGLGKSPLLMKIHT